VCTSRSATSRICSEVWVCRGMIGVDSDLLVGQYRGRTRASHRRHGSGGCEMQQTEHRSFEQADEVRQFPNGRAEILKVGDAEIGRLVFEPGWRWSNDVRPIAGTDSCT